MERLDPLCYCPHERGCGAPAWLDKKRERWFDGSPGPVLHVWVECFAGHEHFLPERLVVMMD